MAKAKISDFRPQERNANRHTPRGLGMLDKSMADGGWLGAMTSAADGEIFDGSARLETAYDRFGEEIEPIVINADGTRPIIVVRTDIPSADHPKAKKLSIAANRIPAVDLDWDPELLKAIGEEVDISDLFFDNEIEHLFEDRVEPEDSEWDSALGDLPSGDKEPFQQMTFTLHDEQVEQVKAAMESAKGMGEFDSLNQNSNGNALARICEIFLTQNG